MRRGHHVLVAVVRALASISDSDVRVVTTSMSTVVIHRGRNGMNLLGGEEYIPYEDEDTAGVFFLSVVLCTIVLCLHSDRDA